MLNNRQIQIIIKFGESQQKYFTADYFAEQLNTSRRTIQNDMKAIKQELAQLGFGHLESKRAVGSCIKIDNQELYTAWLNEWYLHNTVGKEVLSYPLQRVARIIYILLGRFREMPMHELEEVLYISNSTLLKDLKTVQENLAPFDLSLIKNNNYLLITGSEINKRRCLAQNSYYLAHLEGNDKAKEDHIDIRRLNYLKNLLLDAFTGNQYYISDKDFNNAILTLNIMIHRVQKSFFIQKDEIPAIQGIDKEMQIAKKIFAEIENRFFLNIPMEEIKFFAVYLRGQEIFKNHDIISQEMDEFIQDAFIKIKHSYGVDFTNNISLRIAVALHCIPLLVRIQFNMQVHNDALKQVKENFPLGYEIAQYFSFLLCERYSASAKINEEEISLLAAHFYGSLLETRQGSKKMKVLIISSLKASMTILLRAMLLRWFSHEIAEMEFMQTKDMKPELLDKYDVFLTTDKNEFYDKGLAMYINQFPTEHDRKNIKLLLDGFANLDDIAQIFAPELFFSLEHGTKQQILEILSDKAESEYDASGVLSEVLKREKIGSTFFTRGIAIPHPMQAVSSDTFVAVCIVKEPVVWDEEGDKANIILLIHIGRNNPQSFQLWNYLSKIMEDKTLVDELVANPTFAFFQEKIKSLLAEQFTQCE